MLLPPSEWHLKTSALRILGYVHSPVTQMHLKSYCTKVHQILAVVIFFHRRGVDATTRIAIHPPVVEWQGRHLNKKVTSVKPAAPPCGLINRDHHYVSSRSQVRSYFHWSGQEDKTTAVLHRPRTIARLRAYIRSDRYITRTPTSRTTWVVLTDVHVPLVSSLCDSCHHLVPPVTTDD